MTPECNTSPSAMANMGVPTGHEISTPRWKSKRSAPLPSGRGPNDVLIGRSVMDAFPQREAGQPSACVQPGGGFSVILPQRGQQSPSPNSPTGLEVASSPILAKMSTTTPSADNLCIITDTEFAAAVTVLTAEAPAQTCSCSEYLASTRFKEGKSTIMRCDARALLPCCFSREDDYFLSAASSPFIFTHQ